MPARFFQHEVFVKHYSVRLGVAHLIQSSVRCRFVILFLCDMNLLRGWETTQEGHTTLCSDNENQIHIVFAFSGLCGGDLFFPFSWYIVRLQLINATMLNDDRKQARRRTIL